MIISLTSNSSARQQASWPRQGMAIILLTSVVSDSGTVAGTQQTNMHVE